MRIEFTDCCDSFVNVFTGDKTSGEFSEKTKPGGKIFEAFLA